MEILSGMLILIFTELMLQNCKTLQELKKGARAALRS